MASILTKEELKKTARAVDDLGITLVEFAEIVKPRGAPKASEIDEINGNINKLLSLWHELLLAMKKEAIPKYLKTGKIGNRSPLECLLNGEIDVVINDVAALSEGVYE